VRLRRLAVSILVACVVPIVGCGSSSTGPSSGPPDVAGNYSGTVTITFSLIGQTLTCPATLSVTQSGANVNISPATFSGACTNFFPTLPIGSSTIDGTGSLGSLTENNLFVASCNGDYNASASGGFFNRTLQISVVYTAVSGGCVNQVGNFSFTLNVSD
jgi:hypothetical protein